MGSEMCIRDSYRVDAHREESGTECVSLWKALVKVNDLGCFEAFLCMSNDSGVLTSTQSFYRPTYP